jgi:S1-C subfamily serine protease
MRLLLIVATIVGITAFLIGNTETSIPTASPAEFGAPPSPKHLDQSSLFALGASQTVMMLNPDNENSGGTGFAVRSPASGKLYTVTNAHVCNITDKPFLIAAKGQTKLRVQIIEVMEQADLCILQGIPYMQGLEVAGSLGLYDGVFVVGHPELQPINMTAGWVRTRVAVLISYCQKAGNQARVMVLPDKRKGAKALVEFDLTCLKEMDSIMTNNDSKPGNSGSAVLNDRGEVVGVLFAGDSRGTSLIVPLDYLKALLSTY